MSNYFKDFPLVDYRFGDEKTSVQFQHLGTYVDIIDQVKGLNVYYQTYHIQNGERPEQLSFRLYNDVNYYWTFFLLNDHLRQKGWPIRDADIFPKAQEYYPNTVITTTAVTQEKAPKLIDTGNNIVVEWLPTDEKSPLCKSRSYKVGNYVYFQYSKVAAKILKIDQQLGMVWLDIKSNKIRSLDKVMETIPEVEALKVMNDPEYLPVLKFEELEMVRVYDEFDAPHHYEDADGNWIYPSYEATYPYKMNQSSVNTINSVSHYQRLLDQNEEQKAISIIKEDVIDQIASEFRRLLRSTE